MSRRSLLLFLAIAVGVLLAGPARGYTSAGPISTEIQNLFWAITFFAVIVAIVVFGLLLAILVKYRRSASPNPATSHEGSKRLEILWTVIPVVILIVILVISVPVLVYTDTIPKADTTVRVVGSQFIWAFQYEDGTNSTPDLWVQAGIVVKLAVTSTDVIHSFTVPDLGIKIDAFPGHVNYWWMEASVPGDYLIQCAELCGVGHYGMRGVVHVFPVGTRSKIYGPPTQPVPFTDVKLREFGGNASNPWSIVPANLTVGLGDDVHLRIWNNNTAPHDFRFDPPVNESVPTIAPYAYAWLNFTLQSNSPTPVPYGPTNATDRAQGMVGALTIQSGEVVVVTLDDAGAGAGHSWSVSPNPLNLTYGEVYTLEIRNIGSVSHNFTMLGPYSNETWNPLIPPGGTVFLGPFIVYENVTASYQCNIPGHADLGMRATYITGTGGAPPKEGLPLFDMVAITFVVCVPAVFAYVLHHARRPEDEHPS